MPPSTRISSTASLVACETEDFAYFILAATLCAATVRMKYSPSPVPEVPTVSSAQVPAPMIGVSPTRPPKLVVDTTCRRSSGNVTVHIDGCSADRSH